METSEKGPVPLVCRGCETQIDTIAEFDEDEARFRCPECGTVCFVRSDEAELIE